MNITYQVNSKRDLEIFLCERWNLVNEYLDEQFSLIAPPIYNSIDIRESAYKFAPVDANLYPAGFNNLCKLDLAQCGNNFQEFFNRKKLHPINVGILVESHTKNLYYLDHLLALKETLSGKVENVFFVSLDPVLGWTNQHQLSLISQSHHELIFQFIETSSGKIFLKNGTEIDLIIMNNDQSKELPINWNTVQTPVYPSPFMGWRNRQKNHHFAIYHTIAEKFCSTFSINPDLIEAKFRAVSHINFADRTGIEELAMAVDQLKETLSSDTKIFVKASQGTYGMGILVVDSGKELLEMNRRERNKMDVGKNNLKFTSVLLQEGVETILEYSGHPAEITIYCINGRPAGGFMRTNPLRDKYSNLNAKGMVFQKFCISEIKQNSDHKCKEAIYSTMARLSSLACSYEAKDLNYSI